MRSRDHARAPSRAGLAPGLQVLGNGKVGEDAPFLGHEPQAAAGDDMGRPAGDALALEDHCLGARVYKPHKRLHQRRLAGPVAPHERQHGAAREGDVDVEQHLGAAVPGTQGAHGEDVAGGVVGTWGVVGTGDVVTRCVHAAVPR